MKTDLQKQDKAHQVLIALAIVAAAWLAFLGMRGLFIPDEGRYAEIAREMLATGDWITPRLNGFNYFEKPPLQYWLTTLAYMVFGEHAWVARLVPALLGMSAIAFVAMTARRLRGQEAQLFSLIVLASSWAFYFSGQYLTLDMSLASLLGMALCSFLLAQAAGYGLAAQRGWMGAAWLFIALAFLCKGLIAFAIPGMALVAYTLWTRQFSLWRNLHPGRGLLLILIIILPWLLAVQMRNPEFFQFFFVHEQFQRFSTDVHSRTGAWWYYLPVLLLGFLPWTPALVSSFIDHLRQGMPASAKPPGFDATRFCIAWAVAIFLFFSASHSKLPGYILPMFPALALIMGLHLQRMSLAAFEWSAWSIVVLGMLGTAGVSLLAQWSKFNSIIEGGSSTTVWLYAATLALVATGSLALWLLKERPRIHAAAALASGTVLFWVMAFAFTHAQDSRFSAQGLAERLTMAHRPFHPEHPFYSIGQFDHSLPFYLGRTLTLVDYQGEMAPGIAKAPERIVRTVEDFKQAWRAQQFQAFAVMTPARFDEFSHSGLPMALRAQGSRLVIVSRLPESEDDMPVPAPPTQPAMEIK